ncbi:MAG TPA: hypothetical protein VGO47_14375, partial [Chlamydiales bacterium]|nr:hypothetical protein [Chlamydiales bacterium]
MRKERLTLLSTHRSPDQLPVLRRGLRHSHQHYPTIRFLLEVDAHACCTTLNSNKMLFGHITLP